MEEDVRELLLQFKVMLNDFVKQIEVILEES